MSQILRDRDAIRFWAEARGGNPMISDMPDRSLLQITFGQHALNADGNEGPDRPTGGFRLVDWPEWFDELEQQGLALKVNEPDPDGALDNDFRFVSADGGGETTDAARQPAPGSVEGAGERDREEDERTAPIDNFRPAPGEGL